MSTALATRALDPHRDARRIRHEEIVAEDLESPVRDHRGEAPPVFPIVLLQRVFNRYDRVLLAERCDVSGHGLAAQAPAEPAQLVHLGFRGKELARSHVDGERDVALRLEPRRFDARRHELQRLLGIRVPGGQAAFVRKQDRQVLCRHEFRSRVANTRDPFERLRVAPSAHGHGQEVLKVHGAARVRAAAQNVRHRHRQRRLGIHAGQGAEVAVQRLPEIRGSGPRDGKRGREHRVRAEPAKVLVRIERESSSRRPRADREPTVPAGPRRFRGEH